MNLDILKQNPELAASLRFEITGSDIIELIKHSTQIPDKHIHNKPLSELDVQRLLGITRQTLYSWRKQNKIRFHTLGKRIFYYEDEIKESMQTVEANIQ